MELDNRSAENLKRIDKVAIDSFLRFVFAAKAIAAKEGLDVIVLSGHRTWQEQDNLYNIGRRGIKGERKVTNAKAGYSNHNFAIAIDLGVFRGKKYLDESEPKTASRIYREIAKIAKEYNLDWGGDWKFSDEPHFEYHTGLTTAQKRARYLKNKTVF